MHFWVSFFPSGMLSNAVIPPTNEHVFAKWREREEERTTVNTKQGEGFPEVKGEEGANISTPPSRKPVHGHYRDLSMRLRLTGNWTYPFLMLFLRISENYDNVFFLKNIL